MSPQTEQTLHRGRRWISEGTRTFAAGLLVFLPLIVLVVVLLFGGKKIPELMRGLGRGMKEFRDAKDGNDKQDGTAN